MCTIGQANKTKTATLKKQEIEEGNTLIAEAIGGIFENNILNGKSYRFPRAIYMQDAIGNHIYIPVKRLAFHCDYNWLMAALKEMDRNLHAEELTDKFTEDVLSTLASLCECEIIFGELVKFIKHYNSVCSK